MKRKREKLPDEEIDKIISAQADEENAWEKPIRVPKKKRTTLNLPANLSARAAFYARIHKEKNLENWIQHIIQERIDLEEAAFTGYKREIGSSIQQ